MNQEKPNKLSIPQPTQRAYVRPPRDLPAGNLRIVMECYDPSLPKTVSLERLAIRHTEK